jgi:hypothetical protein
MPAGRPFYVQLGSNNTKQRMHAAESKCRGDRGSDIDPGKFSALVTASSLRMGPFFDMCISPVLLRLRSTDM